MSRLLWGNLHTVHKRQFFAALRAAGGVVSFRYPGAYAAPDPAGTFCVNKKYPKSHLNLRFKNPFLGFACPANPRRGLKGCAAGLLERRSLRISSPSSAALVLVELRLPAFQRGTAVQGAHGLTIHSSDSHPYARPSCRVPRGNQQYVRTVRRSKHRHRPIAPAIDQKSEGRSVTKLPRNQGILKPPGLSDFLPTFCSHKK